MIKLNKKFKNSRGIRFNLTTALLTIFLFFVAIKGDKSGGSALQETVDLPNIFVMLKDFSFVFMAVGFVSQILYLRRRNFGLISNISISWLAMLTIYYFRMCLDEPSMIPKLIISFFIYFWITYYIGVLKNNFNDGKKETLDIIYFAMLWFSFIYSFINAGMLLNGDGVLLLSGRFVGFTDHPNFVGMAASIALAVCVYAFSNQDKAERWLGGIGAASALFVLIGSGSRTSLITGSVGVFFIAIRWMRTGRNIWGMNFLFAIVLLVLLIPSIGVEIGSSIGLDAAFIRLHESENTRKDVWDALILQIANEPLIGVGASVTASESSFLRIAAASGLVVGGWFLVNLITVLVVAIKNLKASCYRGDIVFILLSQVIIGSFAEGYLTEFLGLMPVLFVILIAALGISKGLVLSR